MHGIESFEFDARISRAELPVDGADPLVAMVLPKLYLLTQFLDSRDAASFQELFVFGRGCSGNAASPKPG